MSETEKKKEKREENKDGEKALNLKYLTGVASFWRPSRGPTSTMVTREGRSAPRRRYFCCFGCDGDGGRGGGKGGERAEVLSGRR